VRVSQPWLWPSSGHCACVLAFSEGDGPTLCCTVFACRHCHKLVYSCQREDANYRALRRSDRIRDRLGWPAGIANPDGGKPKGMHWRTFERLTEEHDAFVQVSLAATVKRFRLRM